jgi:hypothetical protein
MTRKKPEVTISVENTELPSRNITNCTNVKRAVAQYVYDTLKNSPEGLQSTITIKPERLEDCSVITVIIESSDGIQTRNFYDGWLTILKEEQGGSSQKRKRVAEGARKIALEKTALLRKKIRE